MAKTARDLFPYLSEHVRSGGTCSESQYIDWLNRALSLIWDRGDWIGTISWLAICADGCCVKMPNQVKVVRDAWAAAKPIPVRDQWFSTLVGGVGSSCCGSCEIGLVDTGTSAPLIGHLSDEGKRIRVVFDSREPAGATVRIKAKTKNGADVDIEYVSRDGENRHESAHMIKSVTHVSKDITKYPVYIFEREYCGPEQSLIAELPASITTASFRIYKINNPCGQLIIRAKMKLIPIQGMDDIVPIENEAALAFAMHAVSMIGKNPEAYASNLSLAIDQLEEVIKDEFASTSTPVKVELESEGSDNLVPYGLYYS